MSSYRGTWAMGIGQSKAKKEIKLSLKQFIKKINRPIKSGQPESSDDYLENVFHHDSVKKYGVWLFLGWVTDPVFAHILSVQSQVVVHETHLTHWS